MKTLAIFSDGHTNSTVGLSKSSVQLDDGDLVSASVVRRWLFYSYMEMLEEIEKKKRGELIGLLNGDTVELDDKNRSLQLISHNQEEAISMAIDVWEPFFKMVSRAYVTRGTTAHVGKSAQGEEAFARNFDNVVVDPDYNTHTWRFLPLELDGVRMDIMHHPKGGGGSGATRMNGIMRIASNALFEYANEGEVPPHLVIRSHLHGYRDSEKAFRTRAIITPAMSLLTEYTYRIGITNSNPIGGILIYCHNGEYFVEPLLRKVAKKQWQIL